MEEVRDQNVNIDIVHIIRVLLRKWKFIVLIPGLVTVIVSVYAYVVLDDVYTTETSMIVQVESSGDSDYTSLLTGQRLVDTYTEIAKSKKVLEEVNNRITTLDLEVETLEKMIKVSSVNDTLIVRLTVEGENSSLIADIANTVTEIVKEQSTEYDGLEDIEVFDTADIPTVPSGPNRLLYIAVGILFGFIISSGIVVSAELLDRNIKNDSDIEDYLGIRVLGTIPDYDMGEAE